MWRVYHPQTCFRLEGARAAIQCLNGVAADNVTLNTEAAG